MPRLTTTFLIGISLGLGLLLGVPPTPALAGTPAEQLASQIERVLAVLGDPAFKGTEHAGPRRQAVRRVTDELIAWDEMGRRTLGTHWQGLADEDRRTFVALFSELLNRAYLKNLDRYEGEKIVVTGDSVDGDRAVVRARVVGHDGHGGMPLDFAMVRDGESWRVWDIRMQGMSMVGGYRAQFARLLQTEPYDKVMRRLRERVESLEP
jgi:phospholipid transport system substrate-binding protein